MGRFFKVLGKAESGRRRRRICTVQVIPHKHMSVPLKMFHENVGLTLVLYREISLRNFSSYSYFEPHLKVREKRSNPCEWRDSQF